MSEVQVVRVYITEHEGALEPILQCLHDECRVRGVTVFRGISGFGASGRMHEARWTDLSLDLPIVIEFFDEPERAAAARKAIGALVSAGHILYWPATVEHLND